MSTARIVSLVIAGVAFVTTFVLTQIAGDIRVLDSFAGQIYIDDDASRQRETLSMLSLLSGIAGAGALITFIALTVRDRNRDEREQSVAADLPNAEDRTS